MKERPILFSAPMVRAVLNGSKHQTRRVVKGFALELLAPDNFTPEYVALPENGNSPFGYAGDRLWVREAWRTVAGADDIAPRNLMNVESFTHYEADKSKPSGMGKLRPSMFMPRWASRINLEITGVRVERLQDISEADAIAEGVEPIPYTGENAGPNKFSILLDGCWFNAPTAVEVYSILWESINGEGSWAANPWVWVVEFKRVMP